MAAYSEASRAVFDVFEDAAPVVEGLSIDEAFLDVTGWSGASARPSRSPPGCDGRARAGRPADHRRRGADEVPREGGERRGEARRAPRRATRGGAHAPLHPLPVERLWGVGPVTAAKLRDRGITTVGQVALLSEGALVAMLGRATGSHLHALAHNRDPRPVQGRRRRGSIGAQRARGRSPWSHESVDADLVALVDRVTRRLRAARRVGRTVVLRLRFGDYARATRSHTLPRATASTAAVLSVARGLLVASIPEIERRGLTLVGVSVSNLEDARTVQLVLPFEGGASEALDAAVDQVRDRFGSKAITRGVLLGRDPGLTMPLLPD